VEIEWHPATAMRLRTAEGALMSRDTFLTEGH
jgi:hypothetical protein